jgi:hypothetical protein
VSFDEDSLIPLGGTYADGERYIGQCSTFPFTEAVNTRPPLSEQEQQEQAERRARERAQFDAQMADPKAILIGVLVGIVTLFVAIVVIF